MDSDRPETSGPRQQHVLRERLDVLEDAAVQLDGVSAVVWQAGTADLARGLAVTDELARLAGAARFVFIAEAVARGEVAASQAGSVHQWVGEHAPALAGDGLGVVVKAIEVLARPGNADFDAAVRAGRITPGVALVCAAEWDKLAHRVTEAAAPTVREALVAVGQGEGARQVRRLRPELLARYGLDGELQEREDALKARVTLSGGRVDEAGMTTYEFCCDPEGKAVLEAAIGPLSRPVPDPATLERDTRTAEQRRGRALVEALRRSAVYTSPGAGAKATLVVTVDYDTLRTRMTTATNAPGEAGEPGEPGEPECPLAFRAGTVATSVASGTLLGPDTIRRIACDAQVLPVVLGSQGEILDLGRVKRLFSPSQVKALWVRDGGCTFPGCGAPAAWCDAHHLRHWVDGGPTDLSNAALLCGRHHTIVHRDHLLAQVTVAGVVWDTTPRDIDGEPLTWPGQKHRHRR